MLPAIEAAEPGLIREGDAPLHGETGEGNRGRRDRRRRGNRGDARPERVSTGDAALVAETAAPALRASADSDAPPEVAAVNEARPSVAEPNRREDANDAFVPQAAVEVDVAAVRDTAPEPVITPVVPKVEPRVEPRVEPKVELRPEPRPIVVPRPVPEIPPVSLALPPESGLELVETRFKAPPADQPDTASATGPRRTRPPKVRLDDEPLQMVETAKDPAPPTT
jgi:hypothetical protein